jgi:hypothetical protein
MGLFACEKCGCVENTARGFFWMRDDPIWPDAYRGKKLCSECGPKERPGGEKTDWGQWHGYFPKRSAAGMKVDQDGYLWSTEIVESGTLPVHVRIVVEVCAGEDGGIFMRDIEDTGREP